ncbi:unnamed protein product [Didymodactylos carnosus]|uniref:Uncharacterized protein n=1 Tax=Didymodactylos carnosus TaxID=1234261 RepID=A0A814Z178_9BILA|nr:unnamed protein product [Didymodactylos carnosus]CAF1238681.1 unnamed protein product [Didymodactylos carnosus]CAF3668609.1 unnamed protein product [Didymodactylos carnosus]CAF4000868.1 unnamed protein product [Didymodactylos carnosus]
MSVKEALGDEDFDIFKVQSIKSVHSLLYTKNISGIFDLDCDELINIKERCCFKLKDNSYVIKQGIISSVTEFVDTLKALEQKFKILVKQKQLNLPIMNGNTMKNTKVNALDKWCNNNFNDIVIKPEDDYMINVVSTNDRYVEGSVGCGCGTRILIPLRADSSTFHLSNLIRKDEDVDEMIDETDDNNKITDDETNSIQNDNDKENTKSSSSLASPLTTIDTRLSLKRIYKSATKDSNRENQKTNSYLPDKKQKILKKH